VAEAAQQGVGREIGLVEHIDGARLQSQQRQAAVLTRGHEDEGTAGMEDQSSLNQLQAAGVVRAGIHQRDVEFSGLDERDGPGCGCRNRCPDAIAEVAPHDLFDRSRVRVVGVDDEHADHGPFTAGSIPRLQAANRVRRRARCAGRWAPVAHSRAPAHDCGPGPAWEHSTESPFQKEWPWSASCCA
jgi:hypothetical protein